MSPGRILCAVPFCGRSAPRDRCPDADEIICRKHGRAVPERLRRAYRAHLRLEARGPLTERQRARGLRLWERFKAAAIAAAGSSPL